MQFLARNLHYLRHKHGGVLEESGGQQTVETGFRKAAGKEK